jgi:hypothetical protein
MGVPSGVKHASGPKQIQRGFPYPLAEFSGREFDHGTFRPRVPTYRQLLRAQIGQASDFCFDPQLADPVAPDRRLLRSQVSSPLLPAGHEILDGT